MKMSYEPWNPSASSKALVETCNEIISSYDAQGFTLTVRQLYYQLVSRDEIPNNQKQYKRLVSIISSARRAGMIDWFAIEDRTRKLRRLTHWKSPAEILRASLRGFHMDMWENQETRLEVWIEKDALIGVIERVCRRHDVSYFSCRGYTSDSEVWRAARRLEDYSDDAQNVVIVHLGDHDPSGIDMTRDIRDRLDLFEAGYFEVDRIALNFDQIEQYEPPPNPAKLTDTRATQYVAQHGNDSWELDALEPTVIEALIENKILEYKNPDLWEIKEQEVASAKREIEAAISGMTGG